MRDAARRIAPDLMLLGGMLSALTGSYLLWGLAVTMIAVGVVLMSVGAAVDLLAKR